MERRLQATGMEVREADKPTIAGRAILFNEVTDLGYFREVVRPHSIGMLDGKDIRALWNHNTDYPLGRTTAGTLRLNIDAEGVTCEIDPPDTSWGRDAVASIRRGDVSGMSFGFEVLEDRWIDEGKPLREILSIKLWEVSPVTFPAYESTTVGVRSMEDILQARPHVAPAAAIDYREHELKITEVEE